MKKIILASASSYRRDLLKRLINDFECRASGLDEDLYKAKYKDGLTLSLELAKLKAQDILNLSPQSLVIGSDQCLSLDGEIMGKAHHFEGALTQLKKLQGKTHSLFTSFALMSDNFQFSYTQEVRLKMKNLKDTEINNYLRHDEPYDCAGSYKLELKGILLFDTIECDDYTGIIGLPLMELGKELSKLGYEIF